MSFWKRNLPIVGKLVGTQIILSMLGKMVYLAVSEITFLLVVGIVTSIGLFYYLIYDIIWKAGCDEALRTPDERTNIGPVTGAILGFCGALPGFVLSLVPVLFPLTPNAVGNPTGWNYVIYVITEFFFNGVYGGLIRVLFPVHVIANADYEVALSNIAIYNASMPYYLISIVPVTLIGLVAYSYGLKDKRMFGGSKTSGAQDQKPKLK